MIEQPDLHQLSIDANPNPDNSFIRPPKTLSLPEVTEPITGYCQQFISKKQLGARELSIYEIPTGEHKNWQPMACHFRNIEYTNENVRTPRVLANCLDCICEAYLPYYRQVFNNEAERKKLELFLYDRLRSVRCQLYVQGVFDPRLQMKLVKIILFLETMIGQPVEITGIDYFLGHQIKTSLLADESLKDYYYEALQYAIVLSKNQKLLWLLSNNSDQISNSQSLTQTLKNKLKILNGNYIKFLTCLVSKTENIYTRLILWSQMAAMREIIISRYMKAKMNEKANFLCRVMGYPKMDGWVNVSKKEQYDKFQKNKCYFDLEIKLWIGQAELLAALADLEKETL